MLKQATRTRLPKRIDRLDELAHNMWWSWHYQARDLFRTLDYTLWIISGHNPVKQLRDINPDKLKAAAADPAFIALYDSVMAAFDADMSSQDTWFGSKYSDKLTGLVGYFSMEFAIHNSIPIYAGGLGILAGDICKEASDLGLPMVGVGFMYPQGYFHQRISADGWQEEIYNQLDFSEAPITPVLSPQWRRNLAEVQLDNRSVQIGAWQIQVGRTTLYLLDTNVEENSPQDRQLSARLYIADRELRIQQEIVLGIGGVRVLRALGVNPAVWHANEGHAAFMMLERAREEIEEGASFEEAVERLRTATVFTTHTPVPAGHDVFPAQLMDKYFHSYWDCLKRDRETFMRLGQQDGVSDVFNMTVLALTMSEHRNAVSKLHGKASRKMWHVLWPKVREEDVPITYVTNGIHVPTWVASEMGQLYIKYLGEDWVERQDDPELWKRVMDIPDEEIWTARQILKRRLKGAMLGWAQQRLERIRGAAAAGAGDGGFATSGGTHCWIR